MGKNEVGQATGERRTIGEDPTPHNTKPVQEYLQQRPGRFAVHFTPTHASWLNLVERWSAEITTKRIRRGSWSSVRELERAIMKYVHQWNESGRRFVWATTSRQIMDNVVKATSD